MIIETMDTLEFTIKSEFEKFNDGSISIYLTKYRLGTTCLIDNKVVARVRVNGQVHINKDLLNRDEIEITCDAVSHVLFRILMGGI